MRAFDFFQAVPEILVPDNLKSGVATLHRYEPDLNPNYQDMALHFNVVVIPERVRAQRIAGLSRFGSKPPSSGCKHCPDINKECEA